TGAQAVFSVKSNKKLPVYSVSTEEKKVALTFDAAWGADKTRGIIELLKKFDADATFFLVGFWITRYPAETKYISDCGFEIGNHSNNHLNMSKLNKEDINREISTVNTQLRELTGKTPKFFRPPFGDYDNKLIECIEALDMVAIQWSVDSLDWKGIQSKEIAQRVLSRVQNGSIILFHNNSDYILEALPIILAMLHTKGYKMVSLDEMVATKNFTIDNSGVQHINKEIIR
ncbi:MAG: polysaccharide deacetylase family protein, partial [Clostridia bacterium]